MNKTAMTHQLNNEVDVSENENQAGTGVKHSRHQRGTLAALTLTRSVALAGSLMLLFKFVS
jgi:hypothetical protein